MLSLGNDISCLVNGERVVFDPHRNVRSGLVCISHGHSDHARKHDAKMLMTQETMDITGLDGVPIKYGQEVNGIKAHNAGHVLGSAQFEVNSTVYTGDFLTDNSLLGGAEAIACDDLIIEATFGLPDYVFPSREEIIQDISNWVSANYSAGRTVVIGGYALGKAQELTKIVTDLGITPLVHPKIAAINRIYESHGVALGEWLATDSSEAAEMIRSAFVAVMPFHQVRPKLLQTLTQQNRTKAVAALATGWGFAYGMKCFPLSDHCDFPHLIEYVEEANPRHVYTVHGFAKEFARQLQRRGWNAAPLKSSQKTLVQW